MSIPCKTTARKELTGTVRPSRQVVNLEGRPAGSAQPPKHFTQRQKHIWNELFTLLDEAEILTHLDLMGLNALVLGYELVLHGKPTMTNLKTFLVLAAKFGLTPADRGKVSTTRRRERSPLEQLRAKHAAKSA